VWYFIKIEDVRTAPVGRITNLHTYRTCPVQTIVVYKDLRRAPCKHVGLSRLEMERERIATSFLKRALALRAFVMYGDQGSLVQGLESRVWD